MNVPNLPQLQEYRPLFDWNRHHSRRISTNHQLHWKKGARNILVKSPQCHVTYLSAMKGCVSWYLFGCWWAMYSWTTFKSTRLLCTMFVSRFVKALWSFSILQLLVTKKWRNIWSWSSRNIKKLPRRASAIIMFLPSQLAVGLLGKLYRI